MSLTISKNTIIYILSPANTASGGPELLHQLGATLNQFGLKAFMSYTPVTRHNPVHSAYQHYNVPFVYDIQDEPQNILIAPEVCNLMSLLNNYKHIQKVIWWLSVDNFYASWFTKNAKIKSFVYRCINKVSKTITEIPIIDFPKVAMKQYQKLNLLNTKTVPSVQLHLVQSIYAQQWLIDKGIVNIQYLSDYLNNDFLHYNYNINNKEKIVIFNPAKGFKFTSYIISNAPNIKFVPIKNMSRSEVIQLMKKAMVYIDFGNHPGKDRMPREACMCGCCIITDKKGSAAFSQDVAIPDKYKYIDEKQSIPKILDCINYCMSNYVTATKDFDKYRELIREEKDNFITTAQNIFGQVI